METLWSRETCYGTFTPGIRALVARILGVPLMQVHVNRSAVVGGRDRIGNKKPVISSARSGDLANRVFARVP